MSPVVLDSGGVTWLADSSVRARELVRSLGKAGLWPARVPSAVLVECLTGHTGRDVSVNRLINACVVVEELPLGLARRAALLRAAARRGSAVDAIVVAMAEPGGTVVTSDAGDIGALAAQAADVSIVAI